MGEFRALVRHVLPELVAELGDGVGAAGPHAFRGPAHAPSRS
ncbi:hypothetical protein [Streptomyces sp. NPDC058291]